MDHIPSGNSSGLDDFIPLESPKAELSISSLIANGVARETIQVILSTVTSARYPFTAFDLTEIKKKSLDVVEKAEINKNCPFYINKTNLQSQRSIVVLSNELKVGSFSISKGFYILVKRKGNGELNESGGEGRVSLAIEIDTGTKIAIKMFKSKLNPVTEKIIQRVVNENIEGVVPGWLVSGFSQDKRGMIMPYFNSGSLTNKIKTIESSLCVVNGSDITTVKNNFGVSILKYAAQMGRIISNIHEKNIIHLDLKASNFLLSDDDVFMADLGHARETTELCENIKGLGTRGKRAPEIITGEVFNFENAGISRLEALDMWSFGILLLQAIYGRDPNNGLVNLENMGVNDADDAAFFLMMVEQEIKNIIKKKVSLAPEGMGKLIQLLLSLDPTKRPSGKSFLEQLKVIQESFALNKRFDTNETI